MVNFPPTPRRGSSSTGCLTSLLILAVGLYYGVHIGEVFFRYYQLEEEMDSQARLAPGLTDAVIRRRLLDEVDRLGLPPEAQRFRIVRTQRPAQISIDVEYSESVALPLFKHTFTLRPHADAPLAPL